MEFHKTSNTDSNQASKTKIELTVKLTAVCKWSILIPFMEISIQSDIKIDLQHSAWNASIGTLIENAKYDDISK